MRYDADAADTGNMLPGFENLAYNVFRSASKQGVLLVCYEFSSTCRLGILYSNADCPQPCSTGHVYPVSSAF